MTEATATTWSVVANEAGNELATEEVLYSGLTKAEAQATVRCLPDSLSPEEALQYNFFIRKEA